MAEAKSTVSLPGNYTGIAKSVLPKALILDRIEQNPSKPTPDEVVIAGTRIPVWAIIGHADALAGNIEQVAVDYDISVASVVAAILYYHQNQALIDARLLANECDAT